MCGSNSPWWCPSCPSWSSWSSWPSFLPWSSCPCSSWSSSFLPFLSWSWSSWSSSFLAWSSWSSSLCPWSSWPSKIFLSLNLSLVYRLISINSIFSAFFAIDLSDEFDINLNFQRNRFRSQTKESSIKNKVVISIIYLI